MSCRYGVGPGLAVCKALLFSSLWLSSIAPTCGAHFDAASPYSLTQQYQFVAKGSPGSVAVSPDGGLIVVGGEEVHVWNPRLGREVATFSDENGYITEMKFSPDGRWLVTGSYDEDGGPGAVMVWNVHTRKRAVTLIKGHGIGAIAISADGKLVAAASASDYGQNYVWVWSLRSHKLIMKHAGYVSHLDFSPDSHSMALRDKQGIRVLDISSRRTQHYIGFPLKSKQTQPVNALWFSDPKSVMVVSGNRLTPYDISTGRWHAVITIPETVSTMCRVPGRSEVVVSGRDLSIVRGEIGSPTVSVWDIKTGRRVGHIASSGNSAVAVSADGLTLVIACDRSLDLLNCQTAITILRVHRV